VKLKATDQKLRGGYYTPTPIAEFLCDWAIRRSGESVLEPSCGDGEFVVAAAARLRSLGAKSPSLTAVEFIGTEARKAKLRLKKAGFSKAAVGVRSGDFFTHFKDDLGKRSFDVVIGNPPFIRFQNFPDAQRQLAFSEMRSMGLHPSGLTNAWLPFVCMSAKVLNERGRLAMVIPAELLQVNYAAELRGLLGNVFRRITIVTFKELVFSGILQEVVLLCAERAPDGPSGINVVELADLDELRGHRMEALSERGLKPMDHATEKWTQYFLSRSEILLLRRLRQDSRLRPFGDYASVDVGVVTGLNEFFVVGEETFQERKLNSLTIPIVSRSGHLKGVVFTQRDWEINKRSGVPAHLLNLPRVSLDKLPADVRHYVRFGESKGWHTGYKCRIRKPWYCVPSIWRPDGFMLRQIHQYPKLILNTSNATSTDTIHRVRFNAGIDRAQMTAGFHNSLTFAFSEVFGRSYGGGVLELEPREAEKLLVPYLPAAKINLQELNARMGSGNVHDVLDLTDRVLLIKHLGLSTNEVAGLRGIWQKLQERRSGRKLLAPDEVPSAAAAKAEESRRGALAAVAI
jgi:adenine-specific DNA-methyltransferase